MASGAAYEQARARPVLPRKGRPAALGASPSRIAQRVERGGRREATQGVLFSLIQFRSKGRSSNSVFSTTVLVVRATPAIALIS